MAWVGWFQFGSTEIINNEKVRGVSATFSAPFNWFVDPAQPNVQPAIDPELPAYTSSEITSMPWYDPLVPESGNFFGVYCLGVAGLPDSTRQVAVIENIIEGGSLGIPRRGTRSVTFTCILTAQGRDALEYGFEWLDAVLDSQACGMHGAICGVSDLEFYTDVPVAQGSMDGPTWQAALTAQQRFLHGVGTVDGPHIAQEMESRGFNAYIVSFTLQATRPFIYTATSTLQLSPQIPIVVEDIPYNLEPYPSMELGDGTTPVVATNFMTNPSVETDTTGWTASETDVSGSAAAYYTNGRVTGELSSVGNSSFRSRILGNGSTAASGEAKLIVSQIADLTSIDATLARPSVTVWAAVIISAGASGSVINSLTATLTWLTSAGATIGSPVSLGTAPSFNGYVFAKPSMQPPATWAKAKVTVTADVSWQSSSTPANNSDIRFYVDAMGVTLP
jgi:hypothetical protein